MESDDGGLEEAQQLMAQGLVGAAADLLEDFIEEAPNNHEALLLISQAYQVMGQEDLAKSFHARSIAAKNSENSLLSADQFGTKDTEYLANNAESQPEYMFEQEHVLLSSPTSIDSFEGAFSEDFEVNAEDFDPEFGISPSDLLNSESWEKVVLDEHFVEIDDDKIDYEAIEYHGRLTVEQRARQIVGNLAGIFELEENLFDQLIEVFIFHKCHGQTRKAINSLLSDNPSAQELALVFELRAYWTSKEGFARIYYGNNVDVGYINLSWSLGLALVRSIGAEDIEEMILFVEDCFDDWSCSLRLINGFNSFSSYILHIVAHMGSVSLERFPAFVDYQYFQDDESLAADFACGSVYRWLEENNFLYSPVPNYAPRLHPVEVNENTEDE